MTFHIVLFFSSGVSLRIWKESGLFEREVELYRRMQSEGVRVGFVTYGGPTDLSFAGQIPGITIHCNRWNLPSFLYAKLIPYLHWSILKKADLFKTNQIYGADAALRAARVWGKPLIVRGGFMPSTLLEWSEGTDSPAAREMRRLESIVFGGAARVIVTTESMKREVAERTERAATVVRVIPNFVDVDKFRPPRTLLRRTEPRKAGHESTDPAGLGDGRNGRRDVTERDPRGLIFIGRNSPEKNIPALLEAVDPLDVTLVMIGAGDGMSPARSSSGRRAEVIWKRVISNDEIPAHMNRASIFILPSHREGHPKTLIEAMSCGMAVIGADSPGIREIIMHEETGLISGTDAATIRAAIVRLLEDDRLRDRLGENARRFAVEHFSIDRILHDEMALHKETLADWHAGKRSVR